MHTSLRKEVCGGVWSREPPCRGGSSICWRLTRNKGDDTGTYSPKKPGNGAEIEDGAKGRHRYVGILRMTRKLFLIF